jgi:hypothetical protein
MAESAVDGSHRLGGDRGTAPAFAQRTRLRTTLITEGISFAEAVMAAIALPLSDFHDLPADESVGLESRRSAENTREDRPTMTSHCARPMPQITRRAR